MRESFERVFSVNVPVDRAFSAMTDPEEIQVWFAQRFDSGGLDANSEADTVGGQVGFNVLEFEINEKLHYRQWTTTPEAGLDVTVVFESEATGTRITFTASGFGETTIFESDATRRGIEEALRDLVVYLNHGVHYACHKDFPARCWVGIRMTETFAGGVVDWIDPGSCAERIGLQLGDLVLSLNGGSVFTHAELYFFQRTHEPGDEVEIEWARGGELMKGRDTLDVHPENAIAR